jgi:hypothetical protein
VSTCAICSRTCSASMPSHPPTPHLTFSPTPSPSPTTISPPRIALSLNSRSANSAISPALIASSHNFSALGANIPPISGKRKKDKEDEEPEGYHAPGPGMGTGAGTSSGGSLAPAFCQSTLAIPGQGYRPPSPSSDKMDTDSNSQDSDATLVDKHAGNAHGIGDYDDIRPGCSRVVCKSCCSENFQLWV